MDKCQYKDLNEFLSKHNAKQNPEIPFTHTRIGDKTLNIYGGSYVIPQEELQDFYKLYYDNVFIKKRPEYLTERQLTENSPILIDLDFRYEYEVETRQHTKDHIIDLLTTYLDVLKEFFIFEKDKSLIFKT